MNRPQTQAALRIVPSDTSGPPAYPLGPLPPWPESWYFACRSKDIDQDQVFRLEMAGQKIVVFRDEHGGPTAVSALCSHMGADISYGVCSKGRLTCPLHGWTFDGTGRCVRGYEGGKAHAKARQRRWPAAEAHNHVFIYFAGAPGAPPPDFPSFPSPFSLLQKRGRSINYSTSEALELNIDGPWFWVGANGSDTRHFEVVHGRRCIVPPTVTSEHDDHRTVEYRFEIRGRSWSDRLIRSFLGNRASLTLTKWRGTMMSTYARFGRGLRAYAQYYVLPTSPTTCTIQVILFQPHVPWLGPWAKTWARLLLVVKRWGARSFFGEETLTLRNMGHAPVHFAPEDGDIKRYFIWLGQRHDALAEKRRAS